MTPSWTPEARRKRQRIKQDIGTAEDLFFSATALSGQKKLTDLISAAMHIGAAVRMSAAMGDTELHDEARRWEREIRDEAKKLL